MHVLLLIILPKYICTKLKTGFFLQQFKDIKIALRLIVLLSYILFYCSVQTIDKSLVCGYVYRIAVDNVGKSVDNPYSNDTAL